MTPLNSFAFLCHLLVRKEFKQRLIICKQTKHIYLLSILALYLPKIVNILQLSENTTKIMGSCRFVAIISQYILMQMILNTTTLTQFKF